MSYSKEELLEMYRKLAYSRVFVNKMHEAAFGGLIRSSFHTPLGQEAIGVGIISAMRKTDWIAPTHRLQTALIYRFDTYQFIAELFGKKDGMKMGTVFDFHCADHKPDGARCVMPIGTLGGIVPFATGFAWTLKRQKKDEVVVIVHGDGGCSEGTVYEGWNLAALNKVPAVYVIENNEWAMTVPLNRQSTNPDISRKAEPIGLPIQIVDGNDILAVRRAMDIGLEMARNFQPNVIEMKTLRWDAHFVGQGNDYRTDKDKIEYYKRHNDPLKRYEEYLLDNQLIDQDTIDSLKAGYEVELSEMVERAKNSPIAEKDDIFKKEYIYANPETGGEL